eukprot:4144019-Prymnesium_polylepis.1
MGPPPAASNCATSAVRATRLLSCRTSRARASRPRHAAPDVAAARGPTSPFCRLPQSASARCQRTGLSASAIYAGSSGPPSVHSSGHMLD